jgi:hypothetical protein
MEELIRAALLADPAVSGFVGSRVNFGVHPQGADLPGLVLQTPSAIAGYNLAAPDGVTQGRVQVDCYAVSYGAAKLLSRAVLAALSGWSGGGVQGVFHAGSRDGREGGTNEAARPFRVSLDFNLTYQT